MSFIHRGVLYFALIGLGMIGMPSALAQPSMANQALGERAFSDLRAAAQAADKGAFADAQAILARLLALPTLTDYERAQGQKSLALVQAQAGDIAAARATVAKGLAMAGLSPNLSQGFRYLSAQLALQDGDAQQGLDDWRIWREAQKSDLLPDAHILQARLLLVLKRYDDAKTAILTARRQSAAPKIDIEQTYIAILLAQEQYDVAQPIAEMAAARWAGQQELWRQLAYIYAMRQAYPQVFAVQKAMYVQNWLTQASDIMGLAQAYLYAQDPYAAAQLLRTEYAKGRFEDKNMEAHHKLLADALFAARAWQEAIDLLTQASALMNDGTYDMRLGEALMRLDDWAEAETAFAQALRKGSLDSEGRAWLLLGVVQIEQNKWQEAARSLRQAGEFDSVAKEAFRYLRHMQKRLAQ